jgi:hypothetical protein
MTDGRLIIHVAHGGVAAHLTNPTQDEKGSNLHWSWTGKRTHIYISPYLSLTVTERERGIAAVLYYMYFFYKFLSKKYFL